jgi:sulfane dehydrogenase subunit SoxC
VNKLPGQILKAPEHFLSQQDIQAVKKQTPQGRRDFLSQAFAAAAGITASAAALAQNASEGDPNILKLPAHATGLGQGVASPGYGKPSRLDPNHTSFCVVCALAILVWHRHPQWFAF